MKKLILIGVTFATGWASALAADQPTSGATVAPVAGSAGQDVDNTVVAPVDGSRVGRDADNTGINVRDRNGATETPQNQAENAGDRKLLAMVRRTIIGDKTLSMAAHNVKIVANGGVVTLRGPVKNDNEKAKIANLAQKVAGVTSVDNQLDVESK